jgi:hypothetical protein
VRIILAALAAFCAIGAAANAQTVEQTYSGDPLGGAWRGVAQAVFDYYPGYECAFSDSTDDNESRNEFLDKRGLDRTTPTTSASCKFSAMKCFSQRNVVVVCFDHGGHMLLSEVKFSKKMTKASVKLDYFLLKKDNGLAGLGFAKGALEAEGGAWKVVKVEDTGAWDLREPNPAATGGEP